MGFRVQGLGNRIRGGPEGSGCLVCRVRLRVMHQLHHQKHQEHQEHEAHEEHMVRA